MPLLSGLGVLVFLLAFMDFRKISHLKESTFIKNQVFLRGCKFKLKTMFVTVKTIINYKTTIISYEKRSNLLYF